MKKLLMGGLFLFIASSAVAQEISRRENIGSCQISFADRLEGDFDATFLLLKFAGASSSFREDVLRMICRNANGQRATLLPRGYLASGDGATEEIRENFFRVGIQDARCRADLEYGVSGHEIVAEIVNVQCSGSGSNSRWEVTSSRRLSRSNGSLFDGEEFDIQCGDGRQTVVFNHFGEGSLSYQSGSQWFRTLDEAARNSCR